MPTIESSSCVPRRGSRGAGRPASVASAVAWTLVVVLALLPGCGDDSSAAAAQAASESQQALAEGDASGALHLATRGLARHGEHAALLEAAAAACNALDRPTDASDYALRGLDVVGDDEELAADLTFQRGRAAFAVFRELGKPADWSKADTLLADASSMGRHRAEAASLVVALQFLGGHHNDERARQFARLVDEVDPGGTYAGTVHKMLALQGLEP